MEELYRVRGMLDRGFVGQITYTVCLEKPLKKLDIEFSFDQQRYAEPDVTPELMRDVEALCLEKYGLTGTQDEVRRVILGEMKTEIHTLATLNDEFIGCIHRQLTTRHMTYDGDIASDGCIPQSVLDGVLKVTLLVFNVIKDDTRYALTVRGE